MEKNETAKWSFKRRMVLLTGSIVIILLVYLAVRYLFALAAPFIIAYLIALLIEKPVKLLTNITKGRKIPASVIVVTVMTFLFLTVIIYVTWLGVSEIRSFIANFDYLFIMVRQKTAGLCMDIDGMLGLKDGCCLQFLCNCANGMKHIYEGAGASDMLGRVVRFSFPVLINTAFAAGAVIVCLISVVYLSGVLDDVRKWSKNSIFKEEIYAVTSELKRLAEVYFKIEFMIMAINAFICIIGLLLIKNPYAVVIGLLIGIIDALPFFGTGTVLIPWAVVELLFKNYYSGAVLLTIYVLTYFVREVMESKCMGDKMGIAPFTMLMVIFVGIMVYGIFGFILGPVSYCIIKALIRYFASILENAGGTWYT